jgi:hypothetical protein
MSHKYEAQPFDGGTVGISRKAGKSGKKDTQVASEPFNGALKLNAADYGRFEACMTNPGGPTPGAIRGAALLRKLYSKSS